MSWMAAGWVKHCRLGSAARKAVMLVVADFATEDGSAIGVDVPDGSAVCWASIAAIAEHAEVGASTARRVLTDMEAAGVIRRSHRGRRYGTGGRTTDAIWLEYARPFVNLARLPLAESGKPVDDGQPSAVDDGTAGDGLALSEPGVSARSAGDLVLAGEQSEPTREPPTNRQQPHPGNATHDRARTSRQNGSSTGVDAAPTARARPPPRLVAA
jgi:hypothetical protein